MILVLPGESGDDGVLLDLGEFDLLVEEVVAREVIRGSHGKAEVVLEVGGDGVVAVAELYAHIFIIKELYDVKHRVSLIAVINIQI
jgi:hypothetical protein